MEMKSPVMVYERITRDLSGLYERFHDCYCLLVLELQTATFFDTARRLKDDFGFDQLLEVTGADCPERRPRFEVGYHLYSSRHHKRIRLKLPVPEGEPAIPTLTSLYSPAPFLEREVTERYGIGFGTGSAHECRPALRIHARGNGERPTM
jgi:NADH:ubiquinone oxidoreductase subunit C